MSKDNIDELFLWACGTLYNISRFIDDVLSNRKNYSEKEKETFAQVNRKRILDLQHSIVKDYQEEIKLEIIMKEDLQRILDSSQPILEYGTMLSKKYDVCTPQYYQFLKVCADGGIYRACYDLADLYFFGGFPFPNTLGLDLPEGAPQRDYALAVKYYKKGLKSESNSRFYDPYISPGELSFDNETYCNRMLRYIALSLKGGADTLPNAKCTEMIKEVKEKYELKEYNENGIKYLMCNEKKKK